MEALTPDGAESSFLHFLKHNQLQTCFFLDSRHKPECISTASKSTLIIGFKDFALKMHHNSYMKINIGYWKHLCQTAACVLAQVSVQGKAINEVC